MDLINLSATALSKKIKAKEISSEEVVRAFLKRIETVEPKLNAFEKLDAENALEQAKIADKMLAKGQSLGKLHGVPITIKDTLHVKGYVNSLGTKGLSQSEAAKEDGLIVARLRNEGAIILGMTNVPELLAAIETDNLIFGRTNNPYDLNRTPGGSSGGEAAIIAAAGSPMGLGGDAGGSIRIPCHCCGIAGIKPTTNLVPVSGTAFSLENFGLYFQIAALGPMAKHVEDLYLMLDIIAGPDDHDPHILPIPVQDPATVDLKSLRVVYHLDNGIAPLDEDVRNTVIDAAHSLKNHVSIVDEKEFPDLERTYELLWETFFLVGDGGKTLEESIAALGTKEISPFYQINIDAAKKINLSSKVLRERLDDVERFRVSLFQAIHDYDVIICPVAATAAKLHGEQQKNIKEYTYCHSHNLTGWPAATVRCGTSKEGLPIGVQVVGKPWQEHVVLAVTKQLETIFGGWQAPDLDT